MPEDEKIDLRQMLNEVLASAPAKKQETSKVTNALIGVLATILAGGLGFIGNKAVDSNEKLTRLDVVVPALTDELKEVKQKVEDSAKTLVTRPELESRLAEIRVDSSSIKVEQSKLSIEILKLQQHVGEVR